MRKFYCFVMVFFVTVSLSFCDGGETDNSGGLAANCTNSLTERTTSFGWSGLDTTTITVDAGVASGNAQCQFYKAGVTNFAGPAAGFKVQLGYGPQGSDPDSSVWCWFDAVYDSENGNNDVYKKNLTIDTAGTYSFTFRISDDNGATWELTNSSTPYYPYNPAKFGTITVN